MSTTVYAWLSHAAWVRPSVYREEAKPKPKQSQCQSQQIIPESNPERKKKSVNSNMLRAGGLQQCKLISDCNFRSPHGTIYLNHMDLVVCPSASSKWEPLSSSLNKVARQVGPSLVARRCCVTVLQRVCSWVPYLLASLYHLPSYLLPPSIGPSFGFSIPS